jgi:NIMA (never in mitosis gene a)-related kinase 2
MKQLRHPNIVAFIDNDYGEASGEYDLYMEYCEKGSLFDLIEEKKGGNPGQETYVEEHYIWNVVIQLLAALYVCHYGEQPPSAIVEATETAPSAPIHRSAQIIHGDIKPKNSKCDRVLIGKD